MHRQTIGRLVQNLLHNSVDTIRYSYDMRNMLTESQNRNFSEKLFYADSLSQFSGSSPCYNGNTIVVCHLSNPMSANSLLKIPLIGYTDFWRENVGNKINAYFNSEANETRIMQTVNINMTWTEIIPKSN